MACSCSKGRSARAMKVAPADRTATRGPSRVRFFVSPPPESEGLEEQMFTTVYAAREFLRENAGWFLQTRRVPV